MPPLCGGSDGGGGELLRFNLAAASTKSWLSLAYLIFFGAIIGYTSYIWILRVSTTAKVATYAYVNPVVALFLGWWLANEPFTVRTALASILILGAVALITSVRPHRRTPRGPAPQDAASTRTSA